MSTTSANVQMNIVDSSFKCPRGVEDFFPDPHDCSLFHDCSSKSNTICFLKIFMLFSILKGWVCRTEIARQFVRCLIGWKIGTIRWRDPKIDQSDWRGPKIDQSGWRDPKIDHSDEGTLKLTNQVEVPKKLTNQIEGILKLTNQVEVQPYWSVLVGLISDWSVFGDTQMWLANFFDESNWGQTDEQFLLCLLILTGLRTKIGAGCTFDA